MRNLLQGKGGSGPAGKSPSCIWMLLTQSRPAYCARRVTSPREIRGGASAATHVRFGSRMSTSCHLIENHSAALSWAVHRHKACRLNCWVRCDGATVVRYIDLQGRRPSTVYQSRETLQSHAKRLTCQNPCTQSIGNHEDFDSTAEHHRRNSLSSNKPLTLFGCDPTITLASLHLARPRPSFPKP